MQQRDWLTVFGVAALSCSAMVFAAMVLLAAQPSLWPLAVGHHAARRGADRACRCWARRDSTTLTEDLAEMVRERRAVEQEYYVNFVQSEAFNTEVAALKTRASKLEKEFQQSAAERETQFRDLEQRMQSCHRQCAGAPRPFGGMCNRTFRQARLLRQPAHRRWSQHRPSAVHATA